MKKHFKTKHLIVILLLAVPSFFISGYFTSAVSNSAGAPAGACGDPKGGSLTCSKSGCHGGTAITVSNWISVNTPLTGYIPGDTYTVTATATGSSASTFGFEISPQSSSGTVLGTMTTLDASTQLVGSNNYITHSLSGNSGSGSKTWTFRWTAPSATDVGQVTFYGAFNISNNDADKTGDTIYKTTLTVLQDHSTFTGVDNIEDKSKRINVFPNPVTDHFSISGDNEIKVLSATIYDYSGKELKTINADEIESPCYIGDFKTGYYVLSLQTTEGLISKKLVKN